VRRITVQEETVAASGWLQRLRTIPFTMSSPTRRPLAMISFAALPSGVPAFSSARKISPVETAGIPKICVMTAPWVPFAARRGPE